MCEHVFVGQNTEHSYKSKSNEKWITKVMEFLICEIIVYKVITIATLIWLLKITLKISTDTSLQL